MKKCIDTSADMHDNALSGSKDRYSLAKQQSGNKDRYSLAKPQSGNKDRYSLKAER